MNFVSIRIITADAHRLVAFYEQITEAAATWYTDDFAEVRTGGGTIAIAHERTMKVFSADAAQPGCNRSVILELRVSDVDVEFRRLASSLADVVQPPTTMPWGNRSLLFRDVDGNLVNFFTPLTEEAVARADGRSPSPASRERDRRR